MIKINKGKIVVEKEPLKSSFGFKGKYLTELWQVVVSLESERYSGIGLGTQSVLWSDSALFEEQGEQGGNDLMLKVTVYALEIIENLAFRTPIDLLDYLLPKCYDYAKKITDKDNLRLTFVLNALVPIDNAAWVLYANENKIKCFDEMIPERYRPYLNNKNKSLGSIPLFSYGVSLQEINAATEKGTFFAKIKIGADPDKDGDISKMLNWDKNRLREIHQLLKHKPTEHTVSGHIPYYLDANGRYENKELLFDFLNYADEIGALERIMLIEEPFPEEYRESVHDVPVPLAADESLHSVLEANERMDLGYQILTLKPIAKTLSMSLQTLEAAAQRNVPCFCADLTVNPILVEWNKNFAARLPPLPGMKIAVFETNGAQNYQNWDEMKTYDPAHGHSWTKESNGCYQLNTDFYSTEIGLLNKLPHYEDLLK